MILLDLKVVLFIALLFVLAFALLIWWLLRRSVQRHNPLSDTFQQMCERLPFGVVIAQPDGAIAFRNPVASRMLTSLGAGVHNLINDALFQVQPPHASDTPRSGMISQPLPLRWWRYPLEQQGMLLVLADGSEQQRLVQQQHAFIGQLSHELRTPLTAMVAHTEIARSPQTSDSVRQSSMETLQRETQRMARLVRDLLELHRLEMTADLSLQPTNLALVAEDAIAQVFVLAEQRQLCLTFDADTALPPVLAQPDRLKQVFLNLLDNAIKYCRAGDRITVRLEAQPEGVLCTVLDSGPGIPTEDLPHVTERLYRGRTEIEGQGIGLALVEEILRRHRATLSITSSTEGQTGTQVRWTLRYAQEA